MDDPNTSQGPEEPTQARPPISPGATPPPPPPQAPPPYYAAPPAPKGRGVLGRLFVSLLTAVMLLSVILNVYLWIFFSSVTGGPWEATYEEGDQDARIAIVPIKGVIDSQTASFVHTVVHQLKKDRPRAIVLRVDSGGGGVGASDRIFHELELLKKDPATKNIPIVASFGTMAASGGYYVAAPADFIMAEPTTLTGSIGVIAPFFEIKDMLDHIGLTPEVLKASTSPKKDLGSYLRKWEDDDRSRLTQLIDDAHARFKQIVAEGRGEKLKMPIDAVADGDVYTANEALDQGLVDAIGHLDAAIAKAMELAKIDPTVQPQITVFRPPYRVGLLSLVGGRAPDRPQISPEQVRNWIWELSSPRLEYRAWP